MNKEDNANFFHLCGCCHPPFEKINKRFFFFVSGALSTLEQEIVPDSPPAGASKEYRKSLALSLFYKVHMCCKNVSGVVMP